MSEPSTVSSRPGLKGQRSLTMLKAALPYAVLTILIIAMSILRPETFPTVDNFTNVIKRSSYVIITAVGMTLVIVSGGIDLSVGSIFAFSGVAAAMTVKAGVPVPLAIGCGVATGAGCGLLSGLLITLLRLPPFIATLGVMWAVRGLGEAITHGGQTQIVQGTAWKWLYSDLATLTPGTMAVPVPVPVAIMVVIVLVFGYIARRTRLGRYTYAIGSNAEAARLSGVRTLRIQVILYTLCGALAGLSGMILAAKLSGGAPTEGNGEELTVIAAVVIGGGSLSGGVGTMGGCVIGALLMSFLNNGCNLLGIPQEWQKVISGAIVVLAVAFDQWINRRTR
jgi:ribose transport system permease protein